MQAILEEGVKQRASVDGGEGLIDAASVFCRLASLTLYAGPSSNSPLWLAASSSVKNGSSKVS
jgi:hypothetical protein